MKNITSCNIHIFSTFIGCILCVVLGGLIGKAVSLRPNFADLLFTDNQNLKTYPLAP